MIQVKTKPLILAVVMATCWLHYPSAQPYSTLSHVVPPTPEAISLVKAGFSDVNLYTGRINYGIPLYTIEVGGYSFPVSLNYVGGNGIKVEEVASPVGLGWSLTHTGVIARTIRGLADDRNDGFTGYSRLPAFPNTNLPANISTYTDYYAKNRYDGQPDIFTLSVAGISASFYLNKQMKPVFVEKSELRVKPIYNTQQITSFEVTDTRGYKYYFDAAERTRSVVWGQIGIDNAYQTVAWYLGRIENNAGTELLRFHYDNTVETRQLLVAPYQYTDETVANFREDEITYTDLFTQRQLLRRITFAGGQVRFVPGTINRYDMTQERYVDSVVVENASGAKAKRFHFKYSYFTATGTVADGAGTYQGNGNPAQRLRLDQLEEVPLSGQNQAYTFTYENSVFLPNRLFSFAKDHWGYYNGATGNTGAEARRKVTYYQPEGTVMNTVTVHREFGTANREPSAVHAVAGILKKVQLPTKGEVRFTYEQHSTDDARLPNPVSNASRTFMPGGSTVYFRITHQSASSVRVSGPVTSAYSIAYTIRDSIPTGPIYRTDTLRQGNGSHVFLMGQGSYRIAATLVGTPIPDHFYQSSISWEDEAVSYNKPVGGLRIAQMELYDPVSGKTNGRKYYYNESGQGSGGHSTGTIAHAPSYGYQRMELWSLDYVPTYFSGYFFFANGYLRQLTSTYPLEVTQGSHVGYRKVTVMDNDTLRTVHRFTSFDEFRESRLGYLSTYDDVYGMAGGQYFETQPHAPYDERDYLRGKPVLTVWYRRDGSSFTPVRKVVNTYRFNMGMVLGSGSGPGHEYMLPDRYEYLEGMIFQTVGPVFNQQGVKFKKYHLYTSRYDLLNTVETEYGSAGDSTVKTTSYVYGDTPWFRDSAFHYQPTRITETTSKGTQLHRDMYYPYNWRNPHSDWSAPDINVLKQLEARNMIGNAVLQRSLSGTTHLESIKNDYAVFPGINLMGLATIRMKSGSGPYEERYVFGAYDRFGNILQQSQSGGPPTAYVWGYGGRYPVAEVRNATRSQVTGTGFSQAVLDNAASTEAQVTAQLNTIRNHASMAKAQVTTYTYRPLVGLSGSTDASGRGVGYEYDGFGRLWRVRDHHGNITEEYRYYYKP